MSASGGLGGAGQGSLFTGPEDDPLRYRVDDVKTRRDGGQGIVYRAFDQKGQPVALKLLSGRDIDFDRVLAFAPALARLRHPNLVRQVDVFLGTALCPANAIRGPEGNPFDVLYTVCEWIEGDDLTDAVNGASLAERLGWVADVARGVAVLHADRSVPGGIIHRDIKPSNVRVTPDGRAVLVDYGCARQVDGEPMTENIGTPGWRAPETVHDRQRVGPAADAWGVAAIAYWSLTGEAPELVSKPVHQERLEVAARRADARDPRQLAATVSALLATEQDTRPKNLVRWADELVATGRVSRPRMRIAVAVAAAAVALGGLAAALFGLPEWSARDRPTESATHAGTTSLTTPFVAEGAPKGADGLEVAPEQTRAGASGSDNRAAITVPGASGPDTKGAVTPAGSTSASSGGAPPTTQATSTASTAPPTTAAPPPTTRAPTPTIASQPPIVAPTTWSETTGGETHTWTNYLNAGGQEGPVIPRGTTVQISCKVQGFRVEDGNTWWYRIASSPWSNSFYASADAFYNNGASSGPLSGTPFVDPAVANC